jgi:hypothetical protein
MNANDPSFGGVGTVSNYLSVLAVSREALVEPTVTRGGTTMSNNDERDGNSASGTLPAPAAFLYNSVALAESSQHCATVSFQSPFAPRNELLSKSACQCSRLEACVFTKRSIAFFATTTTRG